MAATLVPDDDTSRTLVGYDTTDRVNVLTAPAPAAGELRPEHSYGYGSGETSVSVAGLAQPNGFARKVKYDAGGRPTEEIDAAGATTKTTWNSADRATSTTDPTGIKSTTIFDVLLYFCGCRVGEQALKLKVIESIIPVCSRAERLKRRVGTIAARDAPLGDKRPQAQSRIGRPGVQRIT